MAFLSDTTYGRLTRNFTDAKLIFLNVDGEYHYSGEMIKAIKNKGGKISTRWAVTESKNVKPFTYILLAIKGSKVALSNIKPLDRTEYGMFDIDYEGEV